MFTCVVERTALKSRMQYAPYRSVACSGKRAPFCFPHTALLFLLCLAHLVSDSVELEHKKEEERNPGECLLDGCCHEVASVLSGPGI